LEKEQSDWNSDVLAMYKEQKAADASQPQEPAPTALKLSNKDKEAFSGKFSHEVAQSIEVVIGKNKNLVLYYAGRQFELSSYEVNKLSSAPDPMIGVIELEYEMDASTGHKTGLRMKLMGEDLAYTKK